MREAVGKVLNCYPDYGKLTDDSMKALADGIAEYLATQDDSMVIRLCSRTDGILARCRFLPTIAEFADLAREFHAKAAAVQASRPTGYAYFTPGEGDPDPPPLDRRKAQVDEWRTVVRPVVRGDRHGPAMDAEPTPKSAADLKTPNAPPSHELLRLLAEQDAA